MLIRLALIFLSLSAFTPVTPINLINGNGQPNPILLKLFDTFNLENDGTVPQLNHIAQEQWLRKPGTERWEMDVLYQDKISILQPILKELGVIDEIRPIAKTYYCIIIYGATVNTMRKSLQFLDKLWVEGVRAEIIIFLTGKRPLDPSKENTKVLMSQESSSVPFRTDWTPPSTSPSDESEAARLVWDQIITHPDLRNKMPYFVSAPMITDTKTGTTRRPNTADTVNVWLDSVHSLPKGKCLAISNNPYIPYQDQTLRCILQQKGVLNENVTLETVGPAASENTSISMHLDNIARWLYTEINTCKRGS